MAIFGIDLGTTYSCISYLNRAGAPEIIDNDRSSKTTPSVVFFENVSGENDVEFNEDNWKIIVGQSALNCFTNLEISEMSEEDDCPIVTCIKRRMGDDSDTVKVAGTNKEFTPTEISTIILKKLASYVYSNLNEIVSDVVITVPAYFEPLQIEATKKAGEEAGFNVLQIITEPSAAIIAYNDSELNSSDSLKDETVLVYDLGGGTFDVTIAQINGGSIQTLAIEGDHFLGGKNWDNCIFEYLAEEFAEEKGLDSEIIKNHFGTRETWLKEIEQAKIQLSESKKTSLTLEFDDVISKLSITREKFDELTEPLRIKTGYCIENALKEAKVKQDDLCSENNSPIQDAIRVDTVLLVGSSTWMPQISEYITELKGKVEGLKDAKPVLFKPNSAVALGAALYQKYAKSIPDEKKDSIPDSASSDKDSGANITAEEPREITEIITYSLGVGVLNRDSNESTLYLDNIILKNSNLPASAIKTYSTSADGQTAVSIKCYATKYLEPKDIRTDDLPLYGVVDVEWDDPIPANSSVEVEFSVDSGRTLTAKCSCNGITKKEVFKAALLNPSSTYITT